jgi:hypothetical protein
MIIIKLIKSIINFVSLEVMVAVNLLNKLIIANKEEV